VQLVYAAHQQQPLKLRAFFDFVAPRLQERLRLIAERYALNQRETVGEPEAYSEMSPASTAEGAD
jgi:hypothetical protein